MSRTTRRAAARPGSIRRHARAQFRLSMAAGSRDRLALVPARAGRPARRRSRSQAARRRRDHLGRIAAEEVRAAAVRDRRPARPDRPGHRRAAGLPARGAAVGVHHVPARAAPETRRPPGVLCAQGDPEPQPDARAPRPPAAAPRSWPRAASIRTRSRPSSPSRCWPPCSSS